MENSARPGTYYFYFNLSKPPFNNALVRQAFAAALDREALTEIAKKYGATNPRPATITQTVSRLSCKINIGVKYAKNNLRCPANGLCI
jgi:ABC-type oligopeptide transport system substrate-binding subunit